VSKSDTTIKIDNVRLSFPEIRDPFEDRIREAQRRLRMNSVYGKLFPPIPVIMPVGEGIWPLSRDRNAIPALEVPEAPKAPQPEALPPESASVQMLRRLLEDRKRELELAERDKKDTLEMIEDLKHQLASEETNLAQNERHVTAAADSIAAILADIKALGGRDEAPTES